MQSEWRALTLPENAELFRKELFTYRIEDAQFDIELFETLQGEYYAIGTNTDPSRLIVYGSTIVKNPQKALEQCIKKINRDQLHIDIFDIGEDASDRDEC